MSPPDDPIPSPQLRTMQIIASTLVFGVAIFLAIVLFLVSARANGQGMAPPAGSPIISLVATLWVILAAPLAWFIPAVQERAALRRMAAGTSPALLQNKPDDSSMDAGQLLGIRQTTMIISLALLEGAALFGCIAYLLEAQTFVLVPIVAAVALMLWNFPTAARVRAWLEHQMNRLAELRQQGGFAEE